MSSTVISAVHVDLEPSRFDLEPYPKFSIFPSKHGVAGHFRTFVMRRRNENARDCSVGFRDKEPTMSPPPCAAGEDRSIHVPVGPKRAVGAGLSIVERSVEAALAALIMGVYLATLYPSSAGGDSGELVAESCRLGVSHPPGYPLFNMLVHVVTTYLPMVFSRAWKANAFSAACDAAAAVIMYRTLMLWTSVDASSRSSNTAAFTASALFAFSPLIWTYAVGAEVFALNNLFAAALLHTLLQYSIDRSLYQAMKGAFLCGLAMCNQHTIILFEIPIVGWVLWSRKSVLLWRELVLLAVAFFVGLLPYAYMPITATWNAQPGSWGDMTSLSGFLHHLRRADYGTFRLFSTDKQTEDIWTRLRLYSLDLSSRQVPLHLVLPLASIGIVVSSSLHFLPQQRCREKSGHGISAGGEKFAANGFGRLVCFMFAFYMVVFHALANLPLDQGLLYGVHMRFWQQPNIIVFLWIGLGLNVLLEQVDRARNGMVASSLARILVLALVPYQLARWYAFCDQSQAFYIRDYASALLDPLPPNALLFVNFDLQWTSLRYLQQCEHRRPDVTILNFSMMTYHWFATKHAHYPQLTFPGPRLVPFGSSDGFSFAQFLDANQRLMARSYGGGIFFGGKLNYDDADFRSSYAFTPYGLLDEVRPLSAKPEPLKSWYAKQKRIRELVQRRLPQLPPADKYDDETWEWTIARDHGMKQLSWSTYLLEKTIDEDPHNLTLLAEATHAMEHSFQFEPSQFWTASSNLKNLGLAYAQIVKSKHEFIVGQDPFLNGVVGSPVQDPTKYKDRASSRMLEVWNEWLNVPDARRDPGYKAIEGVVRQFYPNSVRRTEKASLPRKRPQTKNAKKKKKATQRTKLTSNVEPDSVKSG